MAMEQGNMGYSPCFCIKSSPYGSAASLVKY